MKNFSFLQCFKPKITAFGMLVLKCYPVMSLCKLIMWTWSLTLRKCLKHVPVGYSGWYICQGGLGLCKLLSNCGCLIKALIEVEGNLGSASCLGGCKMWNFIPSRDWEKPDPGWNVAPRSGKCASDLPKQAVKELHPQYVRYECSNNY